MDNIYYSTTMNPTTPLNHPTDKMLPRAPKKSSTTPHTAQATLIKAAKKLNF